MKPVAGGVYDVVIVGLGPTGATAANLLGARGVRTLVIERENAIFPNQRAIAIDEDALRVWQSVGLLNIVMAQMSTDVTMHLHHRNRIFFSCHLRGRGRQGLPGMSFFHQPLLELQLRSGISRYGSVEICPGFELVSIDQDDRGVSVGMRRPDEPATIRHVRGKFLIGCDGGSSTTRKLLGIQLIGHSLDEPWIDIQARAPVPLEPGAPLDFNFIANPERPGAECHSPLGHRRWEFRLHRDEDPSLVNTPEGISKLLAQRGVDAGTVDILQSWLYLFHIRQAERWRQGRVFLCGDAAHIMPPFIGQGISSGVRDAANLCWKIACVLQHGGSEAVLDSYESERRPNVTKLTRFSRLVGALVTTRSPVLAACRDLAFRIAVRLPWFGRHITLFHIKPEWICGPGLFTRRRSWRSPAGQLIWQPWVVPASGIRERLDSLLGSGWCYVAWERSSMPPHLAGLGIRELVIREHGRSWRELGRDQAVDIEDKLRQQFRRHRARGMLVRPDRFIFGSDRDDLCLDRPADEARQPVAMEFR